MLIMVTQGAHCKLFACAQVCRLLFEHDDPRQALNQFQKHVDNFRLERGPESLAFQHLGWLANQ